MREGGRPGAFQNTPRSPPFGWPPLIAPKGVECVYASERDKAQAWSWRWGRL